MKKIAKYGLPDDFKIIDSQTANGYDIEFTIETRDILFRNKVENNLLNSSEKNVLVSSINEYMVSKCESDETFFHYCVGDIIVLNMEGKMDLPEDIINRELLEEKAFTKGEFRKNKFRNLSLSECLAIVPDLTYFIDEIWTGDYLKFSNMQINKIIKFIPDESEIQVEEPEYMQETAKNRIRMRLAMLK